MKTGKLEAGYNKLVRRKMSRRDVKIEKAKDQIRKGLYSGALVGTTLTASGLGLGGLGVGLGIMRKKQRKKMGL